MRHIFHAILVRYLHGDQHAFDAFSHELGPTRRPPGTLRWQDSPADSFPNVRGAKGLPWLRTPQLIPSNGCRRPGP